MKITVDTNILISATFWNGDSQKIIELVEENKVILVLSKEILKEYAEVLQYKDIQEKVEKHKLALKHSILKIAQISTIVEPHQKLSIIKEDPDDNIILECALEGKVDYIISQDKHLLKFNGFEGIKILTPKDFLQVFPKEKS
ncbi:putative toxin-antitoxin system toxin component, PIN family [Candidatus Woesearchaeota archaeon]|nr:putative toxin-antitoxin system toxin component, PIN family [Candidatus Woesearchaeota archaeon]